MTATSAAESGAESASATAEHGRRTFMGYPRWFTTLFVVDMWERFSFYGLVAILYLYLVADPVDGGVGMGSGDAAALVGVYMALVFMASLPGGWISDRVLGPRRTALCGGLLIVAGHTVLALPAVAGLLPGLGLIIAGTGLIKPSMAAMIGAMFDGRPERREAAFSVFYVSIQISAMFAPLITGYVAERLSWHLGFGVAAVGMGLGLVHYALGLRGLGDVGRRPANPATRIELRRVAARTLLWAGLPTALLAAAVLSDVLAPQRVLMVIGVCVVLVPAVSCARLVRRQPRGSAARPRLGAFIWMLAASAVFWMLYAQGPALLNLFALESTDRDVSGFVVPASWFQSAQPLFLLLVAPVFAVMWLRLGSRVGPAAKFFAGVLCAGVAFVVLSAAAGAAAAEPVSPLWLLGAYLFLVFGELAVAPVGLSLAAQVAPPGHDGQVMGLFWLFAAVGAALGGQLAHLAGVIGQPAYFLTLGVLALAVAAALAAARRPLERRLSAGTSAP